MMMLQILSNILLFFMGTLFIVGGANKFSRFVGGICLVVACVSLIVNLGIIL